jgi:hypothetical protein
VKITLRSREEIVPFFDVLEMVSPGLVPLGQWREDGPANSDAADGLVGPVGIARKN